MAFLSTDQRELYLPLLEGLDETPPWSQFLHNLVGRTHARRATLTLRHVAAATTQLPYVLQAAAPRAVNDPPLDIVRLAELGLDPYGLMRSGRVYALDELFDYDDPARQIEQRRALAEMRVNHGRAIRIGPVGQIEAWLVIVREREDLSAADSILLTALAPHLAAALRFMSSLAQARLHAAMAQTALAQIGIGEVAFASGAQVLAIDPAAQRLLRLRIEPGPVRQLQLLPDAARALETACTELDGAPPTVRRLIRLDERQGIDLLLRPAAGLPTLAGLAPSAIGLLRLAPGHASEDAATTIAALHGLSRREAELAHGLTQGESIVEAGARLGLTPETARNYSKRIYAKTGATGQADLVRMLLTGLVPFS